MGAEPVTPVSANPRTDSPTFERRDERSESIDRQQYSPPSGKTTVDRNQRTVGIWGLLDAPDHPHLSANAAVWGLKGVTPPLASRLEASARLGIPPSQSLSSGRPVTRWNALRAAETRRRAWSLRSQARRPTQSTNV
jgi:hypothetical protein